MIKAYISNLSPMWPFAKQETALAEAIPGWPTGVTVYRDELDARERKAHRKDSLTGRGALLRATARRVNGGGEHIYVASLAVFAWTAEDMLECLTHALARSATIHVLDASLDITPAANAAMLHSAAKAFAEGRLGRAAGEAGKAGGEVSGQRRANAAQMAAESIRPQWGLPSKEYPTRDLLRAAGISRNTAKLYLGLRKVAQSNYLAGLKRKNSAYAKRGSSGI